MIHFQLANWNQETEAIILDFEVDAVAAGVEAADKMSELVEALEMFGSKGIDASRLLVRWQNEMSSMSIPARPHLLIQLMRIGMEELHDK